MKEEILNYLIPKLRELSEKDIRWILLKIENLTGVRTSSPVVSACDLKDKPLH